MIDNFIDNNLFGAWTIALNSVAGNGGIENGVVPPFLRATMQTLEGMSNVVKADDPIQGIGRIGELTPLASLPMLKDIIRFLSKERTEDER